MKLVYATRYKEKGLVIEWDGSGGRREAFAPPTNSLCQGMLEGGMQCTLFSFGHARRTLGEASHYPSVPRTLNRSSHNDSLILTFSPAFLIYQYLSSLRSTKSHSPHLSFSLSLKTPQSSSSFSRTFFALTLWEWQRPHQALERLLQTNEHSTSRAKREARPHLAETQRIEIRLLYLIFLVHKKSSHKSN